MTPTGRPRCFACRPHCFSCREGGRPNSPARRGIIHPRRGGGRRNSPPWDQAIRDQILKKRVSPCTISLNGPLLFFYPHPHIFDYPLPFTQMLTPLPMFIYPYHFHSNTKWYPSHFFKQLWPLTVLKKTIIPLSTFLNGIALNHFRLLFIRPEF